jgi:hypothetical protein
MLLPKALRWTLPPLALCALGGFIASGQTSPRQEAPPAQDSLAAIAPIAAGPDRAAAVAKFVARKNGESHDQESFTRAGWQMVDVPPPDAKLVSLDPSLLGSRETELRQQIATNTPSADQAANLARIVREAQEEQTQAAAIEALGRIRSDESQDQLLDLLQTLPEESRPRREIAPLLRPRDLSDPRAGTLAQLLDSPRLNRVERKQIAFTLALIGLRDRTALPDGVQLSTSSRALLDEMTSLASLRTTP